MRSFSDAVVFRGCGRLPITSGLGCFAKERVLNRVVLGEVVSRKIPNRLGGINLNAIFP